MTEDVLALADWLAANAVTHVALESTGVYGKPVYNLLDGVFTLLLVNAQHVKAVPGRKTDVKDREWLADLLRHGLLRASFIPDRPQRELRELTRYRTSLVHERSAEVNRLQQTREGANLKLASVATDILGRSGRAMLDALVVGGGPTLGTGRQAPAALADYARGRMRPKIPQLVQALVGDFGPHQRFLVAQQLAHIDFLDATIAQLNEEVATRVAPFAEAIERLDAIPGVGRTTAEVIVAEIGTDMSRFPSSAHLASWAGMAPGNRESAGKRQRGKTRKGHHALRAALVEAAQAAAHKKDGYLQAQYRRLATRRGAKKAAVAVGHSILVIAYHLLNDPTQPYADLGSHHFDQRDKDAIRHRYVRRLEDLGYRVSCTPAEADTAA